MISKELLSEVLGIDKRLLRIDKIKENYIFFYTMSNVGEYQNYINIYELAHKCKEWAFIKNNNSIASFIGADGYSCIIRHNFPLTKDIKFYANTEVEAITKACQWILDSKKEGN